MKHFLLGVLLTFCSLLVGAQSLCGTYEHFQQRLKDDPTLRERVVAIEKQISTLQNNPVLLADPTQDTISVIFHVLYNDITDSIPESIIRMQIARLNEDYNNLNTDIDKVPAGFKPLIGNMNIKFMLARTDPNGNETSGIEYKHTSIALFSGQPEDMKFTSMGGIDGWPSNEYMNIWVCRYVKPGADNVLGYATFPTDNSPTRDGIVLQPSVVGISGLNLPGYNYGRVLTHEAGHWFGLKHIWGDDATEPNKCSGTDNVDDTPDQDVPSQGLLRASFVRTSCGFSNMWMNYMDYTLDYSKYMFSLGQVSRAKSYLSVDPRKKNTTSKKYLPPVYSSTTMPAIFTSNLFTAACVGKDTGVWVGTYLHGLYRYKNAAWQKAPYLDNRNINQIVSDKKGGIWVAQAGHDGASATGGGIDSIGSSDFSSHKLYSKSFGLAPRNILSIYVDTASSNPRHQVWAATYPHLQIELDSMGNPTQVQREGGLYHGLFKQADSNYFVKASAGTHRFFSIVAGGSHEIWVLDDDAQSDFYVAEILRYDAATEAPLPPFNYDNTGGILPPTNEIKAIYIDRGDNKWVGLLNEGIAFADDQNNWQSISFPEIFPNSSVNAHAITGDNEGNIFIGTTQGLVVYNGFSPSDLSSYTLYTTANGLPSNNVTAVAVDSARKKLVICTDKGVTFWDKDCPLLNCYPTPPVVMYTIKDGNWNDPSIWKGGKVPTCRDAVIINNTITVSAQGAVCASLYLARDTRTNVNNTLAVTITNGLGCN